MSAAVDWDAVLTIDWGGLRDELKRLRAIEAWAIQSLGLDYAVGDMVEIVSTDPSTTGGGWHHYREALAPGQVGTITEIEFSPFRGRWHVMLRLDRSWSIADYPIGAVTRYWNGPVDECPEGMKLRSGGPATKSFYFNPAWVRGVGASS